MLKWSMVALANQVPVEILTTQVNMFLQVMLWGAGGGGGGGGGVML